MVSSFGTIRQADADVQRVGFYSWIGIGPASNPCWAPRLKGLFGVDDLGTYEMHPPERSG
jgi:hypothetical protein